MLGNVHKKKIAKHTGTVVPSILVEEKDTEVIRLIFVSSVFKPGQKSIEILGTKMKIQKNGRR